ncbi:replication endonuclease [Gluconobacter wancherniae]|uniref:hypothetical protein n=1 Tax=Gluconobacter wancherniae TaxID=1307955 RepID=UPI001B8D32E7|nr:hypothetical protein [Gluconobacter wancherniae]MBS1089932.1 hypothetical protein [Gluconobacter wancherniae]
MSYEIIEQYIYDEDINTYDILNALNPFYKNTFIDNVAKKCRLSTVSDAQELALSIVNILDNMKDWAKDAFELASYSYDELVQLQGITNQRLTRRANKCRINVRRALGISLADDKHQIAFDDDKKRRYKNTKYGKYNVQDSLDAKVKHNKSRDYKISQDLNNAMMISGMVTLSHNSGYFATLTLPTKFRALSYEDCVSEINNRINNIKKEALRKNIEFTGIVSIELHKDEVPHIHMIYYIHHQDKDIIDSIIFKFFDNEKLRSEINVDINQEIYNFDGVLNYILKHYEDKHTRFFFIGLKNNIKAIYHNLYIKNFGHKSLSYLSNKRLFKSRFIMNLKDYQTDIYMYSMFILRAFKSDYLNGLGDIDKDEYKIIHHYEYPFFYENKVEKIRSMKNSIYFSLDYRQKKIIIKKARKTAKLYKLVRFSYIYTKNVDILFFDFNIEKSRGQPPPFLEGIGLFSNRLQRHHITIISRLEELQEYDEKL